MGESIRHGVKPHTTTEDNGVLANNVCGPNRLATFGDADCSGSVSIADAQKTARVLVDLTITQTEPCPDIGTTVAVTEGACLAAASRSSTRGSSTSAPRHHR